MQRAIVGIIVAGSAILPLCPRAAAQPTEGAEFEATKNLVVVIEGKLGEAPTQGAGIVFANQGGFVYIATAFHVVRRGENRSAGLKVRFAQKPNEEVPSEHHPMAWYVHDLAVIRVNTPTGLQFRLDRLAPPASVKKGDKVYAIGYPNHERWAVTFNPGFVRTIDALTVAAESPLITEGYSGGALVDQRTLLVGLVQGTDALMAKALRIDQALNLIRRENKLPVQLSPHVPAKSKTNPKDGLEYVLIPPGRFIMGCSKDDEECVDNEFPPHEVRITNGFWMSQTEVTQAAYRRVMGEDPSEFKGAKHPVDSVSWEQAKDYCAKVGLRLPTEAEWEYAARAGSTQARYGELAAVAWHGESSRSGTTHDVGGRQPNAWKLHDMLGNLWEWVADWYGEDEYQANNGIDPKGPRMGKMRGLRGGSWEDHQKNVRASVRNAHEPVAQDNESTNQIGFRCAGELR